MLTWKTARTVRVAGVAVDGPIGEKRQRLLNTIGWRGHPLAASLIRELGNEHDRNAIKMYLFSGGIAHHIGYIPENDAPRYAAIMDSGRHIDVADVRLVGGQMLYDEDDDQFLYENVGVRLTLSYR